MTADYIAFLDKAKSPEPTPLAWALVAGFVDHTSQRFLQAEIKQSEAEKKKDKKARRQAEREKTQYRKEYIKKAARRYPVKLYPGLEVDFSTLLSNHWLGLKVHFDLLTPWYSKDDRIFHLLENPLRKDRLFGVPFMAASSWKGMLRWACRMLSGLHKHLEESGSKADNWQDPDWILHLFGNEKGQGEEFSRGALVFYPTCFNKIGFEVINPHSRERRAGTHPIYYEVVPPGAQGTLSLLYAPWPGLKPSAEPKKVIYELLEAIEKLLTTYGFSAKRTVGWGTAKITKWQAYHKERGEQSVEDQSCNALWDNIQSWFGEKEQQ